MESSSSIEARQAANRVQRNQIMSAGGDATSNDLRSRIPAVESCSTEDRAPITYCT
jgi:hypothetical protein